jgi:hypothetical protein
MNYPPPTENLPIFDPVVFSTDDEALTQSEADKRYLRYPNAQGTENLQAVNVNGIATFNAAANFNQPINMSSATAGNRLITSSSYAMKNGANNSIGNITYNGNNIHYRSTIDGSTHLFSNRRGVTDETNLILGSIQNTMSRPLVMSGALGTDRAVYSTNFSVIDAQNSNNIMGSIYGSGTQYIYDNNSTSGQHNFYVNNASDIQINPLNITSTGIDVNTIMNINNGATPYGFIGTSGSNEIRHQNIINGGSIGFLTKSGGGLNSQLAVTADGLIMLTSGNYIQFPDGTQQTTAATTTPLKTNTVTYTPSGGVVQVVTIPNGCIKIDMMVISSGGLNGGTKGPAYGGTGGGGSYAKTTAPIFVAAGQVFTIRFATSAGNTYILGQGSGNGAVLVQSVEAGTLSDSLLTNGALVTYNNVLVRVINALNGGDAVSADPPVEGAKANAGSANPRFSTFVTNWITSTTTEGVNGGVSPNVATIGGAPRGSKWVAGGIGSGGVSLLATAGPAGVFITYYYA